MGVRVVGAVTLAASHFPPKDASAVSCIVGVTWGRRRRAGHFFPCHVLHLDALHVLVARHVDIVSRMADVVDDGGVLHLLHVPQR